MGKRNETYFIVEGVMNDGSIKYVRVNPDAYSEGMISFNSQKRYCMTDNENLAELFTDASYVTKDIKSFKDNIREKGEIVSLKLVKVTEEVVVTRNFEDVELLWERQSK